MRHRRRTEIVSSQAVGLGGGQEAFWRYLATLLTLEGAEKEEDFGSARRRDTSAD